MTTALGRTREKTAVAHRPRLGSIISRVLLYAVLLILSISFLLPFLWMISTSLKSDPQVYTVPPIWFPEPLLWSNYPGAMSRLPWGTFFLNTLKYAVPSTIGVIVSSAIPAYGFARLRYKGRDTLFFLCLATMMIPFQVQMIPLFIVFRRLGWVNTYLPLVVPSFFGSA